MDTQMYLKKMADLLKSYELPEDAGFGKTMLPVMITCNYDGKKWGEIHVQEYGPLQIDPAAKVLHYAQEIFEGLKAYKNENNEVYLFRPEMNAKRFNRSAIRLAMPPFPEEKFVESVRFLTSLCHGQVPSKLGSSLYLRPFMIATEPTLGVRPSDTYMYVLIASPADNYFSHPSVKVLIEREDSRTTPGGMGFAKTGGNYASSLKAYIETKDHGCDQTLWLDGSSKTYIEELSGMNFFAVINNELLTPSLEGTILAGITRDSLLKVAGRFDLVPVERQIPIAEVLSKIETGECSEVFACGTAAVITPIASLVDGEHEYKLKFPSGHLANKLKDELLQIQRGNIKDFPEWLIPVEPFNLA